jgi:predicted amidophosphoribosyltransferase
LMPTRPAARDAVQASSSGSIATAPGEAATSHRGGREAVRGAFAMRNGGQVDNLRILLLDDVMTTGATLDAYSRALREGGAKSVVGLTIPRAGQPISSFVDVR